MSIALTRYPPTSRVVHACSCSIRPLNSASNAFASHASCANPCHICRLSHWSNPACARRDQCPAALQQRQVPPNRCILGHPLRHFRNSEHFTRYQA